MSRTPWEGRLGDLLGPPELARARERPRAANRELPGIVDVGLDDPRDLVEQICLDRRRVTERLGGSGQAGQDLVGRRTGRDQMVGTTRGLHAVRGRPVEHATHRRSDGGVHRAEPGLVRERHPPVLVEGEDVVVDQALQRFDDRHRVGRQQGGEILDARRRAQDRQRPGCLPRTTIESRDALRHRRRRRGMARALGDLDRLTVTDELCVEIVEHGECLER